MKEDKGEGTLCQGNRAGQVHGAFQEMDLVLLDVPVRGRAGGIHV